MPRLNGAQAAGGRDSDSGEYKRASARTFRLSFPVISVTFAVFSVTMWFCRPFYVLLSFALSPNQSRTDLFCHVFQNNNTSSYNVLTRSLSLY